MESRTPEQAGCRSQRPYLLKSDGACRSLRGRGGAPRGATLADYSLDAFASDAIGVIERRVTTSDLMLTGWSMGVSVALATVALLKPMGALLTKALVFMSGSPAVLRQTSWVQAAGGVALVQEIALRQQRLGLREAARHDAVSLTWRAIRHSAERPLLSRLT